MGVANEDGMSRERQAERMVSVIIPAYNAMRYLPRALESVLNQTYQNLEVVIVDDGSQDGISAWYAQLELAIRQRVSLISQANSGSASARNRGIARSHGPYIAFLDADDIWLPNKLARQIQCLEAQTETRTETGTETKPATRTETEPKTRAETAQETEPGLVYCWAALIDQAEVPTGRLYAERLQPQQAWETLVVRNVISTPSAVLVRRECLQQVGGFDPTLRSYVEDKDLWLRIALHYPIQVLPEVLIYKRRHQLNISKDWQAMEQASYQVLSRAFAAPPDEISDRTLQQLQRQSYGELNRRLAWKPLQTEQVALGVALKYLRKSLAYCPGLIRSKESIKLMCVILAISLVGTAQYRQCLRSLAKARYRFSSYRLSR